MLKKIFVFMFPTEVCNVGIFFLLIRPNVVNIPLHDFFIVGMIFYLAIAGFVWNEYCICGGHIAGCCLFSRWPR